MSPVGLKVSTPSDLEIVMTRSFNAPRRLVWDAMTKPDLVTRWMFVPPGWSWAVCEMDVRVGGRYRWAWNGPDGTLAMTISGEHLVVVPPAKIVHTELMEMSLGAGEACGSEQQGSEPWRLRATIELSESGGVTRLTMTLLFASKEARDAALASGMEQGVSAGYATLDTILATLGG